MVSQRDFQRAVAGVAGPSFFEVDGEPRFIPVPHGDLPAIVVDIDGTVAHNDGHRGMYEYDRVIYDEVKWDVVDILRPLRLHGFPLLFVSGRNDVCRWETAKWLAKWVTRDPGDEDLLLKDNDSQPGPHKLFMRLDGDYREDDIVKYDIYRYHIAPEYDVCAVFDDRDRVVKMWRAVGLTCFQVDYGDF